MTLMKWRNTAAYAALTCAAILFVYPLIWLFFSSFKSNAEIFQSLRLFPMTFTLEGYMKGWLGTGQFTFGLFFRNSFWLAIPTVLLTTISCVFVAYGFARFKFPFHKTLFALMLSTLMMPQTVVIVPRYILFKHLGWLDSYMPFYIPALLGGSAFYIFMQYQFLRGLTKELDESAIMDGCSSFGILTKILIPLSKPAIVSAAIFNFMWCWNEFFSVLIYISSVKKFTVSLGLHMMQVLDAATSWNQIMAMSVLSIIPGVLVFLFAQRYFVEGIATTGIKG